MCVLSIKVPIRKKSGTLSYAPRIPHFWKTFFVLNIIFANRVSFCVLAWAFIFAYLMTRSNPSTHRVVFWPSTRTNLPFQGDAPEGSDTFQWQLWEEIVYIYIYIYNFFVWRCISNIFKNIGSAYINIIINKYVWFLRVFLLHWIIYSVYRISILLLFYTALSIGFWITWILKKENPKIESIPPSADLALGNIRIYIYIYIYIHTHTHTYIYIYIYIYIFLCYPYLMLYIYHHHHVMPPARISLTLSRHFSLLFIASGRSSGLHPVSSHSCCM